MDISKIAVAILLGFSTAGVAGFKQRAPEDRWKRTPNLQPPILDTINLKEFSTITDLFPGCNLYIISPGVHIETLDKVEQPRLYYTDYKQYVLDSFYIPGPGTMPSLATSTFWDLASRTSCKAEIAIDWMPVPKGRTAFPRILIQDFFTLEPRVDSNFVYHILIGFRTSKYFHSMFRWATALQPYKTLRGKLSKYYRTYSFNFIRYMYFFRYAKESSEGNLQNGGSAVRSANLHPDSYEIVILQRGCLACQPHDIVTLTEEELVAQNTLHNMAAHAKKHGTVATHDLAFRELKNLAAVCIVGFTIEFGTYFNFKKQLALDEMFSYRLVVNHKSEADRNSEGRKVLTRAITPVLPEAVIIQSLKRKHSNMTFFLTGDWRRPGGAPLYDGSADTIHGPGFPRSFIDRAWYATYAPVGFCSLRFVTCSNITVTPRSGLLSAPLDRPTWVWLCVSVGAVCVALQLTLKNRRNLSGLLPLFFMVTRILLDNFQDISSKLKKWPTAFAIVAATTALCAITLTNGYRGVLTSDLVMAPEISGPKTFRDILDDGEWILFHYYSSRFTRARARQWGELAGGLYISSRIKDKMTEARLGALEYKPQKPSKDITTLTYEDFIKIDSLSHKNFMKLPESGSFPCPCNRTAFITLDTTFLAFNLPRACMQKINYFNFVRGTDHVLPTNLHWSLRWERPGAVWESLLRLLQSGLYGWLNQMLRHIRGELVVNGQNVMAADTEFKVAALGMSTLIVESTFSVWSWMLVVSVSVFLLELVVHFISISFSFVSLV